MKKTLALLLALVMCFSLAACGGSDTETTENPYAKYSELFDMLESKNYQAAYAYLVALAELDGINDTENTDSDTTPSGNVQDTVFETVEITEENFWEYFEVIQYLLWSENAFGEAENLDIIQLFAVKDGYAETIVAEQSNLAIEVTAHSVKNNIEIDYANKEYEITSTEEIKDYSGIFEFEVLSYDSHSFFGAKLPFYNSLSGYIDGDAIIRIGGNSSAYYAHFSNNPDDYEFLRIQGTLTFAK